MTSSQPSVWHHKPWWCQPWSIILTTIALISSSWWLFHLLWLTLLVAVPVLTWMIFFVGIYPRLYAQALEIPENSAFSKDETPPSV